MRIGLQKLEKGLFPQALDSVNSAIKLLITGGEIESKKREIQFCVSYKVALKLLIEIKLLEKDQTNLIKIAFYTRILTTVPIMQKHRIICTRMAVAKNFDIGNYAVAATLIEIILPHNTPDKSALEVKLQKCLENSRKDNKLLPPFNCPVCNTQVSSGADKCSCGRKSKFCYQSFELITTTTYTWCAICNAVYLEKVLAVGEKCPYCATKMVDRAKD